MELRRVALLLLVALAASAQYYPSGVNMGQPGGYFPASGSTFTYYVSSTGSDSASGLTPATAWQTIAKVNGTTLTPGQSVGFQRGGTWRETLTPGQSGSAGSPITFAAYGSGAKPIINAADTVTSWTGYSTPVWTTVWTASAQVGGGSFGPTQFYQSINERALITGSQISQTGTTIRLELAENTTAAFPVVSMYIGPKAASGDAWAFASAPTQVKVSASGNFTVPQGSGSIYTDAATFTLTAGTNYLVAFYCSSGGICNSYVSFISHNTGTFGWENYTTGTDQSTTLDPATYVANIQGNSLDLIKSIDIQTSSAVANTYSSAVTTQPTSVVCDGTVGVKVGAIGSLNADCQWYWASNTLYVYSSSGDPTGARTIEASHRNYGITSNGKSYLTFSGLSAQNANVNGILVAPTWTGVSVTGSTVNNSYASGVWLNCTSLPCTGALVDGNVLTANGLACYAASCGIAGSAVDVIGASSSVYPTLTVIRRNTASGNYVGPEADYFSDNTIIDNNVSYGNLFNGLQNDGGRYCRISNNVTYHNGQSGILLNQYGGGGWATLTGNSVIGNTIYANGQGLFVHDSAQTNLVVKDNLFSENLSYGSTGYHREVYLLSYSWAGLVWDYNLYYGATGAYYSYGGTGPGAGDTNTSSFSTWKSASGLDANGINANPLLNSPPTDMTLQSGSPAIGAGVCPIAGVNTCPANIGAK